MEFLLVKRDSSLRQSSSFLPRIGLPSQTHFSLCVPRRKSYAASRCDSTPLSARGRTGRRGWARRVLRAALPFQLAMLLWLCAAYLLEPGCCDDLNYLARSLTPQLRYVSGPPPI